MTRRSPDKENANLLAVLVMLIIAIYAAGAVVWWTSKLVRIALHTLK
jgi:hypothetical protein